MTRITVRRKSDPDTGELQDTNEWFADNGIPALPGVRKVSYRMEAGDLYAMVIKESCLGEQEKWFWFSDSDKEWKPTAFGPS